MAESSAPDAYRALLEQYEPIANLYASERILSWDQQVMMPAGGTPARAKQLATLSTVEHDRLTADALGEALDAAEAADLNDAQSGAVREIRRLYERKRRVPRDLVERISQTSSEALPIWQEAKAEDDFEAFAPTLETLVDLRREYAAHIDPDRDPYDVLVEDYEPYLSLETIEDTLTELKEALVPLIDDIRESEVSLADPFEGEFAESDQETVARAALDSLGYDWDRGRLDTAAHPFSTGTQFDTRITTRFDETDPLGSLFSTIHEFGHARYTLGLPQDAYANPLGEAMAMTVHESQSRLWENHVGRSEAFLEHLRPAIIETFPRLSGVDVADLYRAANQVDPDNLTRVEADEVTYHLHIVLRYEIERDLVRGTLDVEEIPAVWNDKMESYLGVRPETDSEGCLQDIHWSHGNFGYFPTYSIGSVLAAQLFAAAQRDLDTLEESIREGAVDPLADWLEDRVHRHGKRFRTGELIERATGEALSTEYYLTHVEEKFGDLYDLEAADDRSV